ncbi:MAG: hypothetical protein M1834_007834 [Cirrosporium novae-zelandiae]|nr:MAG: hypothetical protein M1834_007834 [Cirrosporium novae-zelandiae]
MQYALAVFAAVAATVQAIPAPIPQGVTSDIAPTASAPSGCSASYSGTFGIAVQAIATSAAAKRQARDLSDGQFITQSVSSTPTALPIARVSQIIDGQVQAGLHNELAATTQASDSQVQASATTPVSSPTFKLEAKDTTPATSSAVSSSSGTVTVACKTNSTLELTLSGTVLKDAKGRTGYIASNYQFQFDDPPQAGSIYTAGFSVCSNGSLALGGSNVFYQCLSGNFYNLYDRNWAAQCSPVTIEVLQLVNCS